MGKRGRASRVRPRRASIAVAWRNDERGATLIIVAVTLVAIFAMLTLTVDVGGVLYKRRELVNGADAAALAAAQSCAGIGADAFSTPEDAADHYAMANVNGLTSWQGGIIGPPGGCVAPTKDQPSGYVTVQYGQQQHVFFGPVLGIPDSATVSTQATAAWGVLSGGNVVPVMLQKGALQGPCAVPDVPLGTKCPFWYNNNDLGDADWGFLNLNYDPTNPLSPNRGWNVPADWNCTNAGASDRAGWIQQGSPNALSLNPTPPTYVCVDTGHTAQDWKTLHDVSYDVTNDINASTKLFPVNDCSGQVDKAGLPAPCPLTPDKYDIVGFTYLLVLHVYKGNDPVAIGSTGTCGPAPLPVGLSVASQPLNLDSFASSRTPPCYSGTSQAIWNVVVTFRLPTGPVVTYKQCAPGDLDPTCDYWFDKSLHTIQWRRAVPVTTEKIKFDYDFGAACAGHNSDPNAICLITQFNGYTPGPGPMGGGGENFGALGIRLCVGSINGSCPKGAGVPP